MADKQVTDAAQKKAEERGVDPTQLIGSGSDGKVTAADVERVEEKFLAFANPELGSYVATVYEDGDPGKPRHFYRRPEQNPDGPDAQMVTTEEFAKYNYEIGGASALAKRGGE